MLTLTDNATEKFRSILESEDKRGHGLRIMAKEGASPFAVEYGMAFVAPGSEHAEDKIIEFEGFNVYVDPGSDKFLDSAVVDYVSGLNESGFKITNANAGPPKPTGPLAERIQELLQTRVNPSLGSHGGFISLVSIKDDIAYLQFGGGCQGCGMVDVTLKQGVEVMLKEAVPELKGVRDITDHASGDNPYYK
jgi:Fe/S biogenesis protein NfuA